ncbi:MAG: ABC-2 family transporter protein [Leptospiraceae bacterium]|nr:ABC-2 family transporter protein [Leptospiraceae bacterium]
MKELGIYLKLVTASIKSRMEYRASFFVFIFTLVAYYTAQLLAIGVIIYRFKKIGGWGTGEMAFLYSLLILSNGIVSCFFSGLLDMANFVREGGYDRFLIRPLSPLAQVITYGFELTGLAHLVLGILTFVAANSLINIQWNLVTSIQFVLVILGGSMILASIRIIIGAVAFFAVNNQSLIHLFVFSSREFLLYPLNIYSNGVKFLLTFIVPIAFINYYPAHLFLKKDTSNLFHESFLYATFPVGLFLLLVSLYVWKKGQDAYESAGG